MRFKSIVFLISVLLNIVLLIGIVFMLLNRRVSDLPVVEKTVNYEVDFEPLFDKDIQDSLVDLPDTFIFADVNVTNVKSLGSEYEVSLEFKTFASEDVTEIQVWVPGSERKIYSYIALLSVRVPISDYILVQFKSKSGVQSEVYALHLNFVPQPE